MGLFLRWMVLRESTPAKRRIKAALRGEQPPLPGSYAACPRTDANAMDVASKTGVVRRKVQENQRPDYSIDRWIDMANDLGDDLTALRQNSDKDEKELDKEIDGKKKEVEKDKKDKTKVTDNKDEKGEEEADTDKEERELWKTVKKHLDQKDQGKESSAKSAASSSHSSRSSSNTSRTRR